MISEATLRNTEEWIFFDHNPDSRSHVRDLIQRYNDGDKEAESELVDRFQDQIAFGTAGLRSEVGVGFSKMNTITVQLTTQVALYPW